MKKEKNNPPFSGKELENKIAELTSGWQRTQADFINFKNKTSQERAELIKSANADLIAKILPILDNFRRAFAHIPKGIEENEWTKGIVQIEKQLDNILTEEGLKRIDTKGQEFNPTLHEAISYENSIDIPAEHIIDEYESGWIYAGKAIKQAKVRVSKGK